MPIIHFQFEMKREILSDYHSYLSMSVKNERFLWLLKEIRPHQIGNLTVTFDPSSLNLPQLIEGKLVGHARLSDLVGSRHRK